MSSNKTAIICAGGGMRGAHGGGFLYALGKELGITSPDIIIGSSGDAGNTIYFASGQYDSLKNIWCELLPGSRFISYMRPWKIMDVDYLVDTVFRKLDPLNYQQLKKSPIDWFISITDFQTGRPRYVTKMDKVDPLEALRASKALPIFFGRRLSLFGKKYFDGELGPTLMDHINQARTAGADKILIISHVPKVSIKRKLLADIFAATVPKELRDAIIKDFSTESICVSIPGAHIICVMPQDLPAGTATRSKRKLQATFERGVHDAVAMREELRALLLYK